MKIRTIVAVTCLAIFGFTQIADARPHRARHHAAKKALKSNQTGVSTSTTDVNGDGTSDVVVTTKPKRKPK